MLLAAVTCAAFAVFYGGARLAHFIWYWVVKKPVIDRHGWIEGKPRAVKCGKCGNPCAFWSHRWKFENKLFTEWICPRCIQGGTNVP